MVRSLFSIDSKAHLHGLCSHKDVLIAVHILILMMCSCLLVLHPFIINMLVNAELLFSLLLLFYSKKMYIQHLWLWIWLLFVSQLILITYGKRCSTHAARYDPERNIIFRIIFLPTKLDISE